MQSVYEAAGRDEGLLRLAEAWHARVMADETVSHARLQYASLRRPAARTRMPATASSTLVNSAGV
jgi:hypothetical protein